ncbi:hypothetical protein ACQRIU_007015 [Beauveria bassiana]
MLKLDTSNPKEQAIANALIQRFDKNHFQRLLLEWIVDANVSFRQPEHWRLRRVFEYLNPSVATTNAHISHNTIRRRITDLHLRYKLQIINHFKTISGQIHIAFDGWRSRNRHALYGIVCFYIGSNGAPAKLVLGLPELKICHSGENIAAQIMEILESYEILDKTRWLSTFYMIRRALKLRSFLDDLVEKTMIEVNRERRNGIRKKEELPLCLREESLLNEKDWAVSELLEKVLVDFEEALRMLEGDGQTRLRKGGHAEAYGNIWDVASTYEFLMDRLEEWKSTAENFPDPDHFIINIKLGWDKLNEYYSKLDESPAYYASAILHPVSRWGYFENTWTDQEQLPWLDKAKQMVRKLWEEEYKPLPICPMPDEEPPLKRFRVMSALERHRAYRTSTLPGGTGSSQGSLLAGRDEYDHWLSHPDPKNDALVTDPD